MKFTLHRPRAKFNSKKESNFHKNSKLETISKISANRTITNEFVNTVLLHMEKYNIQFMVEFGLYASNCFSIKIIQLEKIEVSLKLFS